ncbi:hypothetical protein, partial [Serratia marcescens]|uniref:hypothetical protein n=1 Tax=Serratia marcescens TaxID=615 RepID=UPI001CA31A81
HRRGLRILRFSPGESSVYFAFFSLTRRLVSRCSQSVEAHYREFSAGRNPYFQYFFRPLNV